MSEYSRFAVLCLLLVYNRLIQLWHIYTVYLFLFGFFCHRDYYRSSSKIPLAEHQFLLEHPWCYRFLCIYGRKERDNPFRLSVIPTDFCVHVSPYLWIHSCTPPFFFTGTLCVWILRVAFPTRDIKCCCLPHSGWFHLVYDSSRSILPVTSGIIS